jgi:hypothetical protein
MDTPDQNAPPAENKADATPKDYRTELGNHLAALNDALNHVRDINLESVMDILRQQRKAIMEALKVSLNVPGSMADNF